MRKLYWLSCLIVTGCSVAPDNVQPVSGFELNRYLGEWYEIARLDHSFERGLEQVTANYSLRSDGGVRVINKGFNPEKKKWKEAEGKAFFVGEPEIGQLKVSFFGPFYGGYNIIELDKDSYQYSMVCGPNLSYLWILARVPNLDQRIVARLVARAKSLGFETEQLIYVKHR